MARPTSIPRRSIRADRTPGGTQKSKKSEMSETSKKCGKNEKSKKSEKSKTSKKSKNNEDKEDKKLPECIGVDHISCGDSGYFVCVFDESQDKHSTNCSEDPKP